MSTIINPSNLPAALARVYAFRDHSLDLRFLFPDGFDLTNISAKLYYKDKFHAGLVSISISGNIVTATLTKEDFIAINLPVFQFFLYKGSKSILGSNIELKTTGGTSTLQDFTVALPDETIIQVEVTDYAIINDASERAETAAIEATKAKEDTLAAVPALQTDISTRVPKSTTVNGKSLSANIALNKTDIGLNLVDNTPDTSKPVSTVQQTALDLRIPLSQKGVANGVATYEQYIASITYNNTVEF